MAASEIKNSSPNKKARPAPAAAPTTTASSRTVALVSAALSPSRPVPSKVTTSAVVRPPLSPPGASINNAPPMLMSQPSMTAMTALLELSHVAGTASSLPSLPSQPEPDQGQATVLAPASSSHVRTDATDATDATGPATPILLLAAAGAQPPVEPGPVPASLGDADRQPRLPHAPSAAADATQPPLRDDAQRPLAAHTQSAGEADPDEVDTQPPLDIQLPPVLPEADTPPPPAVQSPPLRDADIDMADAETQPPPEIQPLHDARRQVSVQAPVLPAANTQPPPVVQPNADIDIDIEMADNTQHATDAQALPDPSLAVLAPLPAAEVSSLPLGSDGQMSPADTQADTLALPAFMPAPVAQHSSASSASFASSAAAPELHTDSVQEDSQLTQTQSLPLGVEDSQLTQARSLTLGLEGTQPLSNHGLTINTTRSPAAWPSSSSALGHTPTGIITPPTSSSSSSSSSSTSYSSSSSSSSFSSYSSSSSSTFPSSSLSSYSSSSCSSSSLPARQPALLTHAVATSATSRHTHLHTSLTHLHTAVSAPAVPAGQTLPVDTSQAQMMALLTQLVEQVRAQSEMIRDFQQELKTQRQELKSQRHSSVAEVRAASRALFAHNGMCVCVHREHAGSVARTARRAVWAHLHPSSSVIKGIAYVTHTRKHSSSSSMVRGKASFGTSSRNKSSSRVAMPSGALRVGRTATTRNPSGPPSLVMRRRWVSSRRTIRSSTTA
jgi:hypothetical protein